MQHDSNIYATWLKHICNMTQTYMQHDSNIYATWLKHICNTTQTYMQHDSNIYATRLKHVCNMTQTYMQHDSNIYARRLVHFFWLDTNVLHFRRRHPQGARRVACLIHTCDIPHLRHDSFATLLIRDMIHLWHYSFVTVLIRGITHSPRQPRHELAVTCLIHTCTVTQSYVWHDSFTCSDKTRSCWTPEQSGAMSDMTHTCTWHELFVYVYRDAIIRVTRLI